MERHSHAPPVRMLIPLMTSTLPPKKEPVAQQGAYYLPSGHIAEVMIFNRHS